MKNKKGFTLIELLVVIAIIALLLSIVLPSLRKVKEVARRTICQSNLRSVYAAWTMYANDYNDKVSDPRGSTMDSTNPTVTWEGHGYDRWCRKWYLRLYPYLETPEIYVCPSWTKKNGVKYIEYIVSDQTFYVTYTANEFVLSFWHPDKNTIYDWKQSELIHKAVANNPVSLLFSDGIYEVNDWGHWTPTMDENGNPSIGKGRGDYRHGGKANFLVADGRIGSLDQEEVWSWPEEEQRYQGFVPSRLK